MPPAGGAVLMFKVRPLLEQRYEQLAVVSS
jgi:hypothetical protein